MVIEMSQLLRSSAPRAKIWRHGRTPFICTKSVGVGMPEEPSREDLQALAPQRLS